MSDPNPPPLEDEQQHLKRWTDFAISLRQHVEDNPGDLEAREVLVTYMRWLR